MRIPRVFAGAGLGVGARIRLDAPRTHYLKNVLRLKPGAALILFDGEQPVDYAATLDFDGRQAVARIVSAAANRAESPRATHVVQGLSRGDHADWTIQKTTELGVNRISLFNAARTQSPLKAAQRARRLAHWRGIAAGAAEQCGRSLLPVIDFHGDFDAALAAPAAAALRILLDFDGEALQAMPGRDAESIAILLGPEGGLDSAEIDAARRAGWRAASLGPRILRTETAATVALALVQRLDAPG